MEITVDLKEPLKAEASTPNLFLIIVEDMKATPAYFNARKYMAIPPVLHTGPKPKRSMSVGQIVQFMYKRYPTFFQVIDIFESKLGDEIVVLKFNMVEVKNINDINYLE